MNLVKILEILVFIAAANFVAGYSSVTDIKYSTSDENYHTSNSFAKSKLFSIRKSLKTLPTVSKDYYKRSPLVFVPGDGGSQLEAKLNKTTRVHYLCDLESDWFDIWLNLHLLAPLVVDCLVDNLKLHYNITDRKSYNSPGVEIRPTNFGSIDSVEYIDTLKLPKTDYFHTIVDFVTKNNSYTRNVDVVGSAYDFRKAPNELEDFFLDLATLIERAYIDNGSRASTIICHSMGCTNLVHVLNRKSKDWKEVYVKRIITIASPWQGSFKAISTMLFGDNLGIPLISSSKIQTAQSSFPSSMYLFPTSPVFSEDRVLLETPQLNYTLRNLDKLFVQVNMTDQMEMWHDTRKYISELKAPEVEFWCLYSHQIDTPSKLLYKDGLQGKYVEIQGDGDGTVNFESLKACELFSKKQDQPFISYNFGKLDHIDLLRSAEVSRFISRFILSCDDPKDKDCKLAELRMN